MKTDAITLIAAVADNNVIGAEGALPFRQKQDMVFFKAQTMGKPVIMGRKTYDSLGGRKLLGRTVIVLSRSVFEDDARHLDAPVYGARSLEEAFTRARTLKPETEIMIAGGAQIYTLALPVANRLLLTRIKASPQGDAFFPSIDWRLWQLARRERPPQGEGDAYPFVFEDWRRTNP